MVLGQPMRAVGVLPNREAAESALDALKKSGFTAEKVSLIAKDTERNDQLNNADVSDAVAEQAEEGAAAGAVTGSALGGLGGLLVGLSTLAVPGVGPVLAAGTVGTVLATALAGSGIGAASGSLAGAFAGIGIPNDQADVYGDRISQGDYVLLVEGTDEEIRQAELILGERGIEEWGIY